MTANKYIREVETNFKSQPKKKGRVIIKTVEDAYNLFKDMENATQEKFIALHLAGDNSVICFQVVHIGTLNTAIVNPADVLRTALLIGTNALIFLHNHPSGNLNASPQDKEITNALQSAARLFEIKTLDHLIIGVDDYTSMRGTLENAGGRWIE